MVGSKGTTYDCIESGWMVEPNFYKWFRFRKVFIPHVKHHILVLQPLDVSISGPAKTKWKSEIDNYFRVNGLINITNHDFPALMKSTYDK